MYSWSKGRSMLSTIFWRHHYVQFKQLPWTIKCWAWFSHLSKYPGIHPKRRRSPRCMFYFQSKPICKEMFLHFYGISYSRFRWLKEHYEKHCIAQCQHGNAKRLPETTLPQSTIEDVHSFIANYLEENVSPSIEWNKDWCSACVPDSLQSCG